MTSDKQTVELFYKNSKLKEFTAQVIKCTLKDDYYEIILDKTAFYPEGGGQPGDTGTLNGIEIFNTIKRNDEIIHIAKEMLTPHTTVSGEIDFDRRFKFMQQHTGEHILSGVLNSLYGCENVGFHMGSDFVTIDVNVKLSQEQLDKAEKKANRAIYENIPVSVLYPKGDSLAEISYRSKGSLHGLIRLISIDGYDTCACCGTHCSFCGEVGLIKILTSQSYKGGTRIYMLCGEDALEDYIEKNKNIYTISSALSVKPAETAEAVMKLKEELAETKFHLTAARDELLQQKAEKYRDNTSPALVFDNSLAGSEIGKLAVYISESNQNTAFVFSADGDNSFRYAAASQSSDMRELTKKINTLLQSKGGGKAELVQGSIKGAKESIEKILKEILIN